MVTRLYPQVADTTLLLSVFLVKIAAKCQELMPGPLVLPEVVVNDTDVLVVYQVLELLVVFSTAEPVGSVVGATLTDVDSDALLGQHLLTDGIERGF
jgi:hypothetical protein